MLLLGLVVVVMLAMQMDTLAADQPRVASGLLWLALFFAATISLDHSFANEREEGCWDALRMLPLSPTVIFGAKLSLNFLTLSCVSLILIPLFAAFSGAPLLMRPGALVSVVVLADLGLASAGTLIGALINGLKRRSHLLTLLLLPLVSPVVLGAGDATRLAITGDLGGEFWRWLQLLAAFAVIFTTAGIVVCEFVMED